MNLQRANVAAGLTALSIFAYIASMNFAPFEPLPEDVRTREREDRLRIDARLTRIRVFASTHGYTQLHLFSFKTPM